MNTILDKVGKAHLSTVYWYPADMWVMVLSPEDIPIACSAVNLDNGRYLEWEDESYKYMESLNMVHSFEEGGETQWEHGGKMFKLLHYRADYFAAVIYPEEEVISCTAIKPDGEQVCRWVRPDFRGSITAWVWTTVVYGHILEVMYLPNGFDRMWGYVHVDNVISTKYHNSVGAKLVEKVNINGAEFNKFEQDIVDIVSQSKRLKEIWEDNRIGNFDKPSVRVQALKDKQALVG